MESSEILYKNPKTNVEKNPNCLAFITAFFHVLLWRGITLYIKLYLQLITLTKNRKYYYKM